MSDDVFNIPTPFADVAALGQGYAMRADGEYLWVPLPQPLEVGTPVQFVITLADGTPAFAGAGQCVQVADSGEEVHPHYRFETALGALQFDERSQPVYDYLVAVRQAAEQGEAAEGEAAAGDEGAYAEATEATEAEASVDEGAYAEAAEAEAYAAADEGEAAADEGAYAAPETAEEPTYDMEGGETAEAEAPTHTPSIIPTGILKRPAIAIGWKPAPPRLPRASAGSGLFQYAAGALPVPDAPPRPDLDPSLWVQPAPRPSDEVAAPVAEDAYAEPTDGAATDYGMPADEGGYEASVEDGSEEPAYEAPAEDDEELAYEAAPEEDAAVEVDADEPLDEDEDEEPTLEAATDADEDEGAGDEPTVEDESVVAQ